MSSDNLNLNDLQIQSVFAVNGEFAANRMRTLYERWNQGVILTEVEMNWLEKLYTTTDAQRKSFDEQLFIECIRGAEPAVLYAMKEAMNSGATEVGGYVDAFESAIHSFEEADKKTRVTKSRRGRNKPESQNETPQDAKHQGG